MATKVNIGDVVTLNHFKVNNDSFMMTVESIQDDKATCVWIYDSEVKKDSFVITTLAIIVESTEIK